ncbi:MAG TPA: ATP-binding protein, partial [Actinomycetota bacterium]|nr:ATP-binding protein [Actinomycetota bacterium]
MAVRVYIGLLCLTVAGILAGVTLAGGDLATHLPEWLALTLLFALSEYGAMLFHHEGGRQGLTTSEAMVLPMLVALSAPQFIWGITIGAAVAYIADRRVAPLKKAFNIGQFGCSAAIASGLWTWLSAPGPVFTPRNAAVAAACVLVFAVATHIFVAIAISVAERKRFSDLTKDVAEAIGWNVLGNVTLGLLFAAAYVAASWTIVLFLLPLGALHFGYRAVVRQSRERERLQDLHEASRALASSPDLGEALSRFLLSIADMTSASKAFALVMHQRKVLYSAVAGGTSVADLTEVDEGPHGDILDQLMSDPTPIVAQEDDEASKDLREALGATSLVGVPLVDDGETVGCLVVLDRVGAEEFGESEVRLLEAVGNELVLTLDSYRLFAEVAEERERFQQIFAGSKEGICLLDEEGVIRAWNPALARITGFDEEDIIGEKWFERILVRDRHHQRVEGLDIVTVSPDEELELVTRKGPPRWVAIMSGEMQSEDEKSWVILVRDITAEHELEESKSDFLSTISHELRTPLTTIKGSLQVMSRPNAAPQSDIGKQMIEIMKRGSDRLERLVMNLLAVSQMEAGDVQVYPDEVPLEEMVRARIASILIDHPQVEVNAHENVTVRADREKLAQAIEHILDNARKFGPETGMITVEIATENGYARLSITDEGPGIPKIDQDRIFDRFVRLGHVLTRETQGPGVGLFIAKRSVEAMGGSVEVDSEPGRGATFHVRIPLALAAVEPAS